MGRKTMPHRRHFYLFFCALILVAGSAAAQGGNGEKGVINFVTPILSDPVLQHSKETYVSFGCAYCHGVDLHTRGEAADLMHSTLVGKDQNGDFIGAVLRVGIPQTAKLSPMPQFSDLSDREIADIVQWIHYARQEGRYKEIMDAKDAGPGDALAVKAYFDKNCSSCHASASDLANVVKKYAAAGMKAHVIRPALLDAAQSWNDGQQRDAKTAGGRARHQALLENY